MLLGKEYGPLCASALKWHLVVRFVFSLYVQWCAYVGLRCRKDNGEVVMVTMVTI